MFSKRKVFYQTKEKDAIRTYKEGKPRDSVVMIHCRKVHDQPAKIGINQVQETEQELGRSRACFDGIVVQRGEK